MMRVREHRNLILLLLLFVGSCSLFYLNLHQREYDWDLPGYLGSYYKLEYPGDKSRILNETYSAIKKEAPAESYVVMVGHKEQNSWRHFISGNPEAFSLQIPYYSIKVFYIFLIHCFVKSGFSPALSIVLPNMFAYFLFGFMMLSVFRMIFNNKILISAFFTFLLLLLPHFRYLAVIPTPDMIAVLLMVWFLLSVFKKHPLETQAMILILIIFTRPDFIIFGISYQGMVFYYEFLKNKKIDYRNILLSFLMISVYFLILKVNDYPGWEAVFYDSFIQRRNFATADVHFSFQQYLDIVVGSAAKLKKVTLMASVMTGIVFYFTKSFLMRLFTAFLFTNMYLKFLLFPAAGEYRFFSGFLLLLTICALKAICDSYVQKKRITHKIIPTET